MNSYFSDSHVTIYNKDARDMSEIPDNSIQCVVTSPPYWGLRKYTGHQDLIWGNVDHCEHKWGALRTTIKHHSGETNPGLEAHFKDAGANDDTGSCFCSLCGAWKGAYGLEPTPELYVEHTIQILREIRRVLRKDGCVFLNLGDSYYSSPSNHNHSSGVGVRGCQEVGRVTLPRHNVLKSKDLCLIPFRVAISAQADGWWVRSVIIWSKNNPMPESVTDRPTESHEYILMLTKSAKYYYDQEAVRERADTPLECKSSQTFGAKGGKAEAIYGHKVRGEQWVNNGGRNLRSVWTFSTQPYPEAHFATFPEKLPELCIKAATPEVGCCARCGKPWERIVEKTRLHRNELPKDDSRYRPNNYVGAYKEVYNSDFGADCRITETKTIDFRASCDCNIIKPPVPSIVLDPFAGSGTSLWVAKKLNRRAIGYELSEEYCKLALERNRQGALC